MKRILKYFILILLFFPIFIDALTFKEAKNVNKTYITAFDNYNNYFIDYNGGFLSKTEFELSSRENNSYLLLGTSYWTNTSCGTDKNYVISDKISCVSNSTSHTARITYDVKPEVKVSGSGSQGDPWKLIELYELYVDSEDYAKGSVEPKGIKYVTYNDVNDYVYTPKNGYEYIETECINGTASNIAGKNSIRIENVQSDMFCRVIFGNKVLIATLNHDNGTNNSKIYLKYNIDWYSDNKAENKIDSINIPTKPGYSFEGYYYNNEEVISKEGVIKASKTSIVDNSTFIAKWNKCEVGYYSAGSICKKCVDGYTSVAGATNINSCYINVSAGKYLTTANKTTQSVCAKGTYKAAHTVYYGNTSSCDSCPSGYKNTTSTASTIIEQCYLTTTAGKYIATAQSSTQTNCSAGYYSASKNVFYGSTNACTKCSAGYYSNAGSSTCTKCAAGTYNTTTGNSTCQTCPTGYYCTGGTNKTACPSGYTSATGATAQNKCYINVSAGKYIATAKSSTQTSCAAGKYKTAHTVYYGNTSSCDSCPSGYTSATGATAQNKCYINVSAGKYIATAKSSTQTSCAAGTYKVAHTVYYGSTSSCDSCPSGTTSPEGSTSSSACKYELGDRAKTLGTIWSWIVGGQYCSAKSQNYCGISGCNTYGILNSGVTIYVNSTTGSVSSGEMGGYVYIPLTYSSFDTLGSAYKKIQGYTSHSSLCPTVPGIVNKKKTTFNGTTYVYAYMIIYDSAECDGWCIRYY